MPIECNEEEIRSLLSEGAELWYFYLDGGVAIHQRGEPLKGKYCPTSLFLSLRENGAIERKRRNNTGYPFYANNVKSDVYTLV